jgi:hypothetical protein
MYAVHFMILIFSIYDLILIYWSSTPATMPTMQHGLMALEFGLKLQPILYHFSIAAQELPCAHS